MAIKVYRVGDLDKYQRKADSMYQMFGRSTGYFGTGYYFCTRPEYCCTMTRDEHPLYRLTLKDGIKLLTGDTNTHEKLKAWNAFMINYPRLLSKDLIDKEKRFAHWAMDFYTEDQFIGTKLKEDFEVWGDWADNWKEYLSREHGIRELIKRAKDVPDLEEFANILENDEPNFERLDEIQKENEDLFDYDYLSSMRDLVFTVLELLPIELHTDTETIKMAADHIYETYESFYENGRLKHDPDLAEDDSFPTQLLKILGYEGVWPSSECDNTTYGGVIFDLENFTYERIADHAKDYIKKDLKESVKEDCYIAYHLSPNLFGDFDMDHIGSGFGTGLMGYGLYFTLDSEVVSYYRSQLEDVDGPDFQWYLYKVSIEGNIVDEYDPEGWELYAKLVEEKGEKAASEAMLNEYHIDGVKYEDPEDGRSILVFNPKAVHIIHCKPIDAYGKLELWEN